MEGTDKRDLAGDGVGVGGENPMGSCSEMFLVTAVAEGAVAKPMSIASSARSNKQSMADTPQRHPGKQSTSDSLSDHLVDKRAHTPSVAQRCQPDVPATGGDIDIDLGSTTMSCAAGIAVKIPEASYVTEPPAGARVLEITTSNGSDFPTDFTEDMVAAEKVSSNVLPRCSRAPQAVESDSAGEEGSGTAMLDTEPTGDEEEADKMDGESRYWISCYVTHHELQQMEDEGLLPPSSISQWRSAEGVHVPKAKQGERVMLVSHIIRGLGIPPSVFCLEVLDYYGLQPHNLSPNSLLYIAGFQALFEGYLGMSPSLDFFKYCFHVRRQTVGKKRKLVVCGTVRFNLHRNRGWYPKVPKIDSVKGWTGIYFYCKDIPIPG